MINLRILQFYSHFLKWLADLGFYCMMQVCFCNYDLWAFFQWYHQWRAKYYWKCIQSMVKEGGSKVEMQHSIAFCQETAEKCSPQFRNFRENHFPLRKCKFPWVWNKFHIPTGKCVPSCYEAIFHFPEMENCFITWGDTFSSCPKCHFFVLKQFQKWANPFNF